MKKQVHRVSLVALCGLIAIAIGAWAVWTRDTSKVSAPSEAHAPWLVLEPGTEVLFELSRQVEPGDWPKQPCELPGGGELVPPPPPPDGKYWAKDWLLRWQGLGLVWATKTQLLYVAPNDPGGSTAWSCTPVASDTCLKRGRRPKSSEPLRLWCSRKPD